MDIQELMRLERQKAVIKALAELEIALNTFYNDKARFDALESIRNDLINYKQDWLD